MSRIEKQAMVPGLTLKSLCLSKHRLVVLIA